MTPTELHVALMFAGSFMVVAIALAIGYGAGYVDGRASKRLWTEDELTDKLQNN